MAVSLRITNCAKMVLLLDNVDKNQCAFVCVWWNFHGSCVLFCYCSLVAALFYSTFQREKNPSKLFRLLNWFLGLHTHRSYYIYFRSPRKTVYFIELLLWKSNKQPTNSTLSAEQSTWEIYLNPKIESVFFFSVYSWKRICWLVWFNLGQVFEPIANIYTIVCSFFVV